MIQLLGTAAQDARRAGGSEAKVEISMPSIWPEPSWFIRGVLVAHA
jgi:hypothetical protein